MTEPTFSQKTLDKTHINLIQNTLDKTHPLAWRTSDLITHHVKLGFDGAQIIRSLRIALDAGELEFDREFKVRLRQLPKTVDTVTQDDATECARLRRENAALRKALQSIADGDVGALQGVIPLDIAMTIVAGAALTPGDTP